MFSVAAVLFFGAIHSFPSNAQPHQQSKTAQQPAATYQRGTDDAPVVIRALPSPKTNEEAAQEQADRQEKTEADTWIIRLTGVLALVGVLQLAVFGIQAHRLKQTIDKMDTIASDETRDMKASIDQATRAATAMEGVAAAMAANVENARNMLAMQREFWQRQMRAYVSVVVGAATYQERDKELKFAGIPRIINDGMTPAYNVRSVSKSAIVKLPLDPNFIFDLPEGTIQSAPAIGPRQFRDIQAVVEDYVPDQDVAGIKDLSSTRGLMIWGRVDYDDAFGGPHYANFAQILYWLPDDAVRGIYEPRHNNSD